MRPWAIDWPRWRRSVWLEWTVREVRSDPANPAVVVLSNTLRRAERRGRERGQQPRNQSSAVSRPRQFFSGHARVADDALSPPRWDGLCAGRLSAPAALQISGETTSDPRLHRSPVGKSWQVRPNGGMNLENARRLSRRRLGPRRLGPRRLGPMRSGAHDVSFHETEAQADTVAVRASCHGGSDGRSGGVGRDWRSCRRARRSKRPRRRGHRAAHRRRAGLGHRFALQPTHHGL